MPSVAESIFGIGEPKYAFGSTEVLLDRAIILRDEPEIEEGTQQSVISGYRTFIDIGEHWIFEVQLNLFFYADPAAKWNIINGHKRQLVTLWRRRDKEPVKDSSGDVVLFKVTRVQPVWIDRPDFPDQLIITFRSSEYVDISYSTEPLQTMELIDELNEIPIITEDGQGIILG